MFAAFQIHLLSALIVQVLLAGCQEVVKLGIWSQYSGCRFHPLNPDTVLGVKAACLTNSVGTTVPQRQQGGDSHLTGVRLWQRTVK